MEMERTRLAGVWKLVVLLVMYTLSEAVALLMGLRIIPYISGVLPVAALPWLVAGMTIENWLVAFSGRDLSPDRLPWAFGMMYIVPIIAGFAGRAANWLLVLSTISFLGLMARIIWCWAGKKPCEY